MAHHTYVYGRYSLSSAPVGETEQKKSLCPEPNSEVVLAHSYLSGAGDWH